jgi:hypothetical protein
MAAFLVLLVLDTLFLVRVGLFLAALAIFAIEFRRRRELQ